MNRGLKSPWQILKVLPLETVLSIQTRMTKGTLTPTNSILLKSLKREKLNVSHWVLPLAFFRCATIECSPSLQAWCLEHLLLLPRAKSYFGILCFNSALQLRLFLPLCFLMWMLCFDHIVFYSSREMGLPFGLENLSVLRFELEMILLDHLRSW